MAKYAERKLYRKMHHNVFLGFHFFAAAVAVTVVAASVAQKIVGYVFETKQR